jgi:hypothetical protein
VNARRRIDFRVLSCIAATSDAPRLRPEKSSCLELGCTPCSGAVQSCQVNWTLNRNSALMTFWWYVWMIVGTSLKTAVVFVMAEFGSQSAKQSRAEAPWHFLEKKRQASIKP